MSLLGTQVYANPSTPCWVSASGDTINGNLTVNGNISATGSVTAGPLGVIAPDDGNGFSVTSGATVKTRLQHIAGGARTLLSSSDPIYFTQPTVANGNSSLTISAYGAGTDSLVIGGRVTANQLNLNSAGGAAVIGTATLASGSAIVSTTASDVGAFIFLTRTDLNASTAVGELRITNKSANNFTVNSVSSTGTLVTGDLSSFQWMIINPV